MLPAIAAFSISAVDRVFGVGFTCSVGVELDGVVSGTPIAAKCLSGLLLVP